MDEHSQIHIPESFIALFRTRTGRLPAAQGEIVARYDLCEDLASVLAQQAQALYHGGHASEEGVLAALHAGLTVPDAAVAPREARWIVLRVAEMLQWRTPALAAPHDDGVGAPGAAV